MIQNFVGREAATTKLKNLLLGQSQGHGKLIVQSIDGPGGIGKTSLFDYALAGADLSARNYLTLRVDGNEATGLSLARLISRMVDNAAAEVIRDKPAGFYFPSVARVVKAIDELRNQAIVEFSKRHPDDEDGREKLARILDALLDTGKAINDVIPASKKRIDFREMEKVRPVVDKAILTLDSLKLEPISFLEKIGIGSSRTLRNAIRENACVRWLMQWLQTFPQYSIATKRKTDSGLPTKRSAALIAFCWLLMTTRWCRERWESI